MSRRMRTRAELPWQSRHLPQRTILQPSVEMLKRVARRLRERGSLPEAAQLLEWAAEMIERQASELGRR